MPDCGRQVVDRVAVADGLLPIENRGNGHVGKGQGIGELVGGQRSRVAAEHVKDTQTGTADLQREREHGPDASVRGGGRVDRPPGRRARGEVRDQHRATGIEGIHARPFTEHELQVVDVLTGGVRCAA
jgi:hypothetical protein